jgi:hypothetical protein
MIFFFDFISVTKSIVCNSKSKYILHILLQCIIFPSRTSFIFLKKKTHTHTHIYIYIYRRKFHVLIMTKGGEAIL